MTTHAPVEDGPAEAADSLCETELRLSEGAGGVALDPDPGFGRARVVWSGDLNGDGVEDLVLRFGDACSGLGECPHAVGAGCGSGGLDLVWGPEYAVEIEPLAGLSGAQPGANADFCEGISLEAGRDAWLPLVEVSREGEQTTNRNLCFSGAGYTRSSSAG